MTDRKIMQQALADLKIAEVDGNCNYRATELLRTRLAQPEQERNFCQRCGKRTNDIHTCTPPKENT